MMITGSVNGNSLSGYVNGQGSMGGTLSGSIGIIGDLDRNYTQTYDDYAGPYEVVPSRETQTLRTNRLLMTGNVTIAPIPSNYGLIEWNGSVLRVS